MTLGRGQPLDGSGGWADSARLWSLPAGVGALPLRDSDSTVAAWGTLHDKVLHSIQTPLLEICSFKGNLNNQKQSVTFLSGRGASHFVEK